MCRAFFFGHDPTSRWPRQRRSQRRTSFSNSFVRHIWSSSQCVWDLFSFWQASNSQPALPLWLLTWRKLRHIKREMDALAAARPEHRLGPLARPQNRLRIVEIHPRNLRRAGLSLTVCSIRKMSPFLWTQSLALPGRWERGLLLGSLMPKQVERWW